LSNEDLIGLQQSNAALQDARSDEDIKVSSSPARVLQLGSLASVLQKVDKLMRKEFEGMQKCSEGVDILHGAA
jgi:hypothetical protein